MRKSVQEAKQSIHEARGGNRSGERRPGEDEVVARGAGPLKPVGDNCVRAGHGQTRQAREKPTEAPTFSKKVDQKRWGRAEGLLPRIKEEDADNRWSIMAGGSRDQGKDP